VLLSALRLVQLLLLLLLDLPLLLLEMLGLVPLRCCFC